MWVKDNITLSGHFLFSALRNIDPNSSNSVNFVLADNSPGSPVVFKANNPYLSPADQAALRADLAAQGLPPNANIFLSKRFVEISQNPNTYYPPFPATSRSLKAKLPMAILAVS